MVKRKTIGQVFLTICIIANLVLGGDAISSCQEESTPSVDDGKKIHVTGEGIPYQGQHRSAGILEDHAQSTLTAYYMDKDIHSLTGYLSTYGKMSGEWLGDEVAEKIELEQVATVYMKGNTVESRIGFGNTGISIKPYDRVIADRNTSSGYNTQVHLVNIPESVVTHLNLSGGWVDYTEQKVTATFYIPGHSEVYRSTSIVGFDYDI